jgi:hypothetical protein
MHSIRTIIVIVTVLVFNTAVAHHVDLPEDMSPAKATWLWGHHAIPGDITLSGSPYWYSYPHTDVKQAWRQDARGTGSSWVFGHTQWHDSIPTFLYRLGLRAV